MFEPSGSQRGIFGALEPWSPNKNTVLAKWIPGVKQWSPEFSILEPWSPAFLRPEPWSPKPLWDLEPLFDAKIAYYC